ncbi:methylated-DNA--[protein]-cysteine S-methyltransferase [Ferrimonas balearica]|uniref:methylated-DNA--[protein]-cysteine S-methyltransferase n=1 Tax=Ferrimonas balearica TaxID=44012 RepID=UPI001C99DFCA|nr:methylated-DNA--[protein]-cysteine S-methyltransferase [Ferrimonas balearica]MBY5921708.1 methylated-DNA--[protein]-cysteine S-methyltransferase [Ferrimonas balearica]MBY5994952.1 methylated-DNA--[protein]-cysteine S-methyltransferase [Ferrimonas balearica]
MSFQYLSLMETPLGPLAIMADERAIQAVQFVDDTTPSSLPESALTQRARAQLKEYFTGHRQAFDLPLAPTGTPFRQAAWQALCAIPYGETRSYAEQADRMGNPKAVRAVGAANGANPIAILIPCHRVIGKNGSLTGYAGGLNRKAWLLALEQGQIQP